MLKLIRTIAVLLLYIGVSYCQSEPQGSSTNLLSTTYPNTPTGLEVFFSDALKQSQAGSSSVLAFGNSLVLPHADTWFASEFGNDKCDGQQLAANDCLGPRLAAAYASYSDSLAPSFEMTLKDLTQEGLTNFEAVNYTALCPSPMKILPSRELIGNLTTTPFLSSMLSGVVQRHEPVYVVWAYGQEKETTLGFFVYVDGAFRYIGMPHPITTEAYLESRNSGSLKEAQKVAPHYLTDEQVSVRNAIVDSALVARTVVLNVVVDKDGKPKEVSYVKGPEQFKEEALQSVRKRRFDPPGFGPRGIHPNVFCLNWTPSR